jgi:hypothetical protein
MRKYIQELRLLRIVMICFTLVLAILSRFAGDEVIYSGWKIIPTLIAPALVPILFFVIWLDVLMSWVFRIDALQEEKRRFGRVIAVDLVLVVVLVSSWFGYFNQLVS